MKTKTTTKGLIREKGTYKGVKYTIKEDRDGYFAITINGHNDDYMLTTNYIQAKCDVEYLIRTEDYIK